VPDFFKLPEGMNFGEVPRRGGEFEGTHLQSSRVPTASPGPAFGPTAAQLLEVGPQGLSSSARSARTSMAGRLRIPSASTGTTTSGPSTRART
jgi:hypothetical protein